MTTHTQSYGIDPRIAPPKPFDALIFDCDGTLANTMPCHYQAWLSAVRAYSADFPEDLFYEYAGVGTRDIIRNLNRRFGYSLDVDTVYAEKEAHYLKLVPLIKEISAVTAIARAQFGAVPMAVASGGTHEIVDSTLNVTGLRSLFDFIVTTDDVQHGKPAPDVFLLAADLLGVKPENCVVYEDGEPGIIAAQRAGMRVVDVRVLWQNAEISCPPLS